MSNDGQAPVTTELQDDSAFYAAISAEIEEAMARVIANPDGVSLSDWLPKISGCP